MLAVFSFSFSFSVYMHIFIEETQHGPKIPQTTLKNKSLKIKENLHKQAPDNMFSVLSPLTLEPSRLYTDVGGTPNSFPPPDSSLPSASY